MVYSLVPFFVMKIPGFLSGIGLIAIFFFPISTTAQDQNVQGTPHRRNYFYAGGNYVTQGNSTTMDGPMYIEHLVPLRVTKSLPLLMIHGHAMTGTNFLNTPDGRQGWADFLLSKGYEVYIVDQPVRGRSAFLKEVDGPQSSYNTFAVESRFTATERYKLWPQATLHTQWPGNGSMGDPIFDNFFASTVPSLVSDEETSVRIKSAGSALLDKIGPVNLLTHSQSGPLGWILADSRPNLIKSIVAIEPTGPPFVNIDFHPLSVSPGRPFGITEIPVQYDPPISSANELQPMVFMNTSIFTCFQQAPPARKLVNLMKIPILMVTSEASYHAIYDNCTANYLQQAGVPVQHINLADIGIHGNAHMMFMEKNNIEIAEFIERWVTERKV